MMSELDAFLAILLVIILIYFFLWKRSKIIGSFIVFLTTFAFLIPLGGTDYELIAWIAIFIGLTITITEFAFAKVGVHKNG